MLPFCEAGSASRASRPVRAALGHAATTRGAPRRDAANVAFLMLPRPARLHSASFSDGHDDLGTLRSLVARSVPPSGPRASSNALRRPRSPGRASSSCYVAILTVAGSWSRTFHRLRVDDSPSMKSLKSAMKALGCRTTPSRSYPGSRGRNGATGPFRRQTTPIRDVDVGRRHDAFARQLRRLAQTLTRRRVESGHVGVDGATIEAVSAPSSCRAAHPALRLAGEAGSGIGDLPPGRVSWPWPGRSPARAAACGAVRGTRGRACRHRAADDDGRSLMLVTRERTRSPPLKHMWFMRGRACGRRPAGTGGLEPWPSARSRFGSRRPWAHASTSATGAPAQAAAPASGRMGVVQTSTGWHRPRSRRWRRDAGSADPGRPPLSVHPTR